MSRVTALTQRGGKDGSARETTFRELLVAWRDLTGRYWRLLVLAAMGLTLLDTAVAAALGDRISLWIGDIFSAFAIFLILRKLLRDEGMIEQEGGFVTFYVVSWLCLFGCS